MTDKEIDDQLYWHGYSALFDHVQAGRITTDEACWCLWRRDRRTAWMMVRNCFVAASASVIVFATVLLLSGCCLTGDGWHENVYVPVMSGARWDGWVTTQRSE